MIASTEIPTIIDPSATINYPSAAGTISVGISVPAYDVSYELPVFHEISVCFDLICIDEAASLASWMAASFA